MNINMNMNMEMKAAGQTNGTWTHAGQHPLPAGIVGACCSCCHERQHQNAVMDDWQPKGS